MTFKQMFTSSIGKKLVMSLTGLFLITFLIIHVSLNACIWANDNGELFNVAAHFMGSTILVRITEVGLFAGIIIHLLQGYVLSYEYQKKRSVGYAVSYGERGSRWYSRSMGLLGTLLLLFLIMHVYHFWVPSRFGGMANITAVQEVKYEDSLKEYHNLYAEMLNVFQNPLIVILYVLGCVSLAYHLMHGFESSFRTIGVHNNRYLKMLRYTGRGFAIIISIAFAMMPVSMYLGWVK
ncbi:MAG: succinate dehydrogenase cytochrome b subunit [Segetibacter sp.]